ncbi:MAG: redox-active disulfide protein 2 [bacterium]
MKLEDKPTEKLEGELKALKLINNAIIGVLSLLFIVCIYGLLFKEDSSVFSSLIVVPIALSAIIPLNYGNIKKIRNELVNRKH